MKKIWLFMTVLFTGMILSILIGGTSDASTQVIQISDTDIRIENSTMTEYDNDNLNIQIYYNGILLTQDVDYDFYISNLSEPGYATVTITGQENVNQNGYEFIGTVKKQILVTFSDIKLTPVLTDDGVMLRWSGVSEGELGYYIYRKDGSGAWTQIGQKEASSDLNEYSFEDKIAIGDVTSWTICPYNANITADCEQNAASYLRPPEITSVIENDATVEIRWKDVPYASGYAVYRGYQERDTEVAVSYVKVKDIARGEACIYAETMDTNVHSEHTDKYGYTKYKIIAHNDTCSGLGQQIYVTPLSAATDFKVKNEAKKGVTLTWKAYGDGIVDGYNIYRKKENENWEKLITYTWADYCESETPWTEGNEILMAYIDTSAISGCNYSYKVEPVASSDEYCSVDVQYPSSKVVSIMYLARPKTSVKKAKGTNKVSWKKIKGAKGYRVYRKKQDGKWKLLKNIKKGSTTSYKDKKISSKTKYYYTVIAYNGKAKSGYDKSPTAMCEYAEQFIGTPYVWGGSDLISGVDCSGFTMCVYKKFGITLPHSAKMQAKEGKKKKVKTQDMKAGDLYFWGKGDSIYHVLMYCGNGKVMDSNGKVEEGCGWEYDGTKTIARIITNEPK